MRRCGLSNEGRGLWYILGACFMLGYGSLGMLESMQAW